jgi:hypothetical protein
MATDATQVLVGTANGAVRFVARASGGWERIDAGLAGSDVSAVMRDPRDGRWLAAANTPDGPRVLTSADAGATWSTAGGPFAAESIWQVAPGRADRPGELFAGLMPAELWRSSDAGATWAEVRALSGHPSRKEWFSGAAGLCLHTILVDDETPGRIYVGISAAGIFRSDDDGATWTPANDGTEALAEAILQSARPDVAIEWSTIHRCTHKVAMHPTRPGWLVQQDHLGVYRSEDAGVSWIDLTAELPSPYGFGIAIGGGETPAIWVIPQDIEKIHTTERLSVWRSDDLGATWRETTAGLPVGQHSVQRDALTSDGGDPATVAFGTTKGTLYLSRDGETWETVAEGLPRIRSVRFA